MARYMLILRSTPAAEVAMAEQNIDFDQIIESMGRYNEELIKAGVMLAGEGLAGPEEGFAVNFDSEPPVVTDGPYTEAKELFNGFWILDVSSIDEAKQWALKCPLGHRRSARGATGVRDRGIRPGTTSGSRRKSSGGPISPRRLPTRLQKAAGR